MKHLLVPIDFSDASNTMLANLDAFRPFGAKQITLVYVRSTGLGIRPGPDENQFDKKSLERPADRLRDKGWTVDTRLRTGRPSEEIVDTAKAVGADHIIIANRGKSGVQSVMLGSVASSVLESAALPTFLFNVDAPAPDADDQAEREGAEPWDRIVLPTDFSEANEAATQRAITVALDTWLPVTLFHAVDTRYHGQPHIDEQRAELKALAQRFKDAGIESVSTQLIPDRPKRAILEIADHYPSALFIMGTHGRGFFGDLMLGGVSRTMARRGGHHSLFIPVD